MGRQCESILGDRRTSFDQDWVEVLDWTIFFLRSFVDVESHTWPGDQFSCVGVLIYVLLTAQSRVEMRTGAWTRLYTC